MQNVKKIVLAYSGGLDTSAIIPWLKENYGCEVVAFAADVGQGDEELEGLHEKAIASGASECHIVDERRCIIQPVGIRDTVVPGPLFTHLLESAMEIAYFHIAVENSFAVEGECKLNRAMRRWMRRAHLQRHDFGGRIVFCNYLGCGFRHSR